VDKEVSLDITVAAFTEVRKESPNEEQLEYIQNFVNGNRKKAQNVK
jgi:hypothetical protein